MGSLMDDSVLYRNLSSIKIGQVERYIITYKPPEKSLFSHDGTLAINSLDQSSLFVKVKNCESITKRAAYLMGPYILYVDARPYEYEHKYPCYISADQPKFDPNLQANQSFVAELSRHTIKEKYVWIIDIASQMLFSSTTAVNFEIVVGKTVEAVNSSIKNNETGIFDSKNIHVLRMDTKDLWSLPPPIPNKPVHLTLLTHGLHSNVGADMLYLKEQIEKAAVISGDNVIVRGYDRNVCKTERGIKYLGMKVAEYIINEVYAENITHISFIGHSLGGLIQTFAIAYIESNFPWFFKKVTPVNFITLASPLLGISHIDSPGYVQAALTLGAVGRTGQELSLFPTEIDGKKALLELLPTGITHKVLKKFKNRTVYANAVNDGIVPLRTSAILFLDYRGLREVAELLSSGKTSDSFLDMVSKSRQLSLSFISPFAGIGGQTSKRVYNIPEFMNSMPFVYSSNPVISVTNESVDAKPNNTIITEHKVSDTLKHTQELQEVSPKINNHAVTNEMSKSSLLAPRPAMPDRKLSEQAIGEIPNRNDLLSQKAESSSFFSPLQNAFASWVAPQGTNANNDLKKKFLNSTDNPLPKASIIDSAKSILLPPLPPKQFIIEPNARKNPLIHDKVYGDNDICEFKMNRRKDQEKKFKHNGIRKQGKEPSDSLEELENINDESKDFALNPFADNFSNFFASKSNIERLEEKIAMKWHDGMSWRKVLVNINPDAHNNILVRRRFANAFGWLVIDHLVDEHFGENIHAGESIATKTALDNELDDLSSLLEKQADEDFISEPFNHVNSNPFSISHLSSESILDIKETSSESKLTIPKSLHLKQSPKAFNEAFSNNSGDSSAQELDCLLGKDLLIRENASYNYTPYLNPYYLEKSPVTQRYSESGKHSRKNSDINAGDWINTKNYNEDSLFEGGPTGFLSNVNDKISKII